mgnify:CR=1 FL=1
MKFLSVLAVLFLISCGGGSGTATAAASSSSSAAITEITGLQGDMNAIEPINLD